MVVRESEKLINKMHISEKREQDTYGRKSVADIDVHALGLRLPEAIQRHSLVVVRAIILTFGGMLQALAEVTDELALGSPLLLIFPVSNSLLASRNISASRNLDGGRAVNGRENQLGGAVLAREDDSTRLRGGAIGPELRRDEHGDGGMR